MIKDHIHTAKGASNMRIISKMDGIISKLEIDQLYNKALPSNEDIKQQVDEYLDHENEIICTRIPEWIVKSLNGF